MKIILSTIAILIGLYSFAQIDTTKCVEYSTVVQIDSLKKDDIFARCLQWINNNTKDLQSVIQIQDKAKGILLVKSVFVYTSQNNYDVRYTLKIQVKDGKFKFEMFNFNNDRSYSAKNVPYLGMGPICLPYVDKQGGTMKSFREQTFAEMVRKTKTEFDISLVSLKSELNIK